jgi:hypothetical protein
MGQELIVLPFTMILDTSMDYTQLEDHFTVQTYHGNFPTIKS